MGLNHGVFEFLSYIFKQGQLGKVILQLCPWKDRDLSRYIRKPHAVGDFCTCRRNIEFLRMLRINFTKWIPDNKIETILTLLSITVN